MWAEMCFRLDWCARAYWCRGLLFGPTDSCHESFFAGLGPGLDTAICGTRFNNSNANADPKTHAETLEISWVETCAWRVEFVWTGVLGEICVMDSSSSEPLHAKHACLMVWRISLTFQFVSCGPRFGPRFDNKSAGGCPRN